MTQEEKQLLLKDLCARLPYSVKCYYEADGGKSLLHVVTIGLFAEVANRDDVVCKPYLRPMSSMTEGEKRAFDEFICIDEDAWLGKENGCVNQAKIMSGGIDWLNAHHLDYRGLIEKGLALEASKGMYKLNRNGNK